MPDFRLTTLSSSESGIWRLYKSRDRIYADPPYQRLSDIWPLSKKQLLIDTIINGFDVPKLYFHRFPGGKEIDGRVFDYSIIDGKQRLEAVFGFIDGDFSLSDDFEYFDDTDVSAAGLKYADLARDYPDLKTAFDSYVLNVIAFESEDEEMIEDLFSRLNEAVPLSAAEKRNAFGGPAPKAIREFVKDPFFESKLPFSNSRYRHFNLAAMFLINVFEDEITDTKKVYLDQFVSDWKERTEAEFAPILDEARTVTKVMEGIFNKSDPLLRQIGMIIIYFHAFRTAIQEGWVGDIKRKDLSDFNDVRLENRRVAEEDLAEANYDLLEFDRYSQSPNDAYAVKFRLKVFLNEAFGRDFSLDEITDN